MNAERAFGDLAVGGMGNFVTVLHREHKYMKSYGTILAAIRDLRKLGLLASERLEYTLHDTDVTQVHFAFNVPTSVNIPLLARQGFSMVEIVRNTPDAGSNEACRSPL